MKRVMVVDDERPVVDGIVRTIRSGLEKDFEVAATASSGREALEKAAEMPLDIVIMDVRMPGLTGLETIRELKRRGTRAVFVLSTAYERFDIVRDALELGVAGYLLKPVVADKLSQALMTASQWIDRQREQERLEFVAQEKELEVRGLIVATFLSTLMLGQSSAAPLKALRDWLGVDDAWGLMAVASMGPHGTEAHARLEEALHFKTRAFCGPLLGERCAILVPLASRERAQEFRALIQEIVDSVFQGLNTIHKLRVGFSGPRPLEELPAAWVEALSDLAHQTKGPVTPGRLCLGVDQKDESSFWNALEAGSSDSARNAFEALLEPLEPLPEVPLQERYRVIALLASSVLWLRQRGRLDEEMAWHWLDFDELRMAPNGKEFCLVARSRLPVLLGAVTKSKEHSPLLGRALDVIHKAYGEALTLESLAGTLRLSPKRLSRLFVEEMGQGFSEYLINYRLEKAKILLTFAGASIKQVSAECGYPDPNYFARLFKKMTGQTPTEFSMSRGNTLPFGRTPGIMEP